MFFFWLWYTDVTGSNTDILTEIEPWCKILKDGECTHPGRELLYEVHANQTPDDPDNVLVHVLGHWRLTRTFHDLVFHPKITVSITQEWLTLWSHNIIGRCRIIVSLWNDLILCFQSIIGECSLSVNIHTWVTQLSFSTLSLVQVISQLVSLLLDLTLC